MKYNQSYAGIGGIRHSSFMCSKRRWHAISFLVVTVSIYRHILKKKRMEKNMSTTIVLDAGHGGYDFGASYQGRSEKEDALKLTLAVGKILSDGGYEVVYTRTTDIYQSPFEKAQIANQSKADYFISFHRNSGPMPNAYHGVEGLVFSESDLVVLRKTNMPAVLMEVGFVNSDVDNRLFDSKFEEIANAIATGIMESVPLQEKGYAIQIGLFKYESNADYQAELAKDAGFDAEIAYEEPYYAVRIPAGDSLEDATRLQNRQKRLEFDTLLITV